MTIIDRVRMNGFMIVGADDTGLGGRFSLFFLAYDMGFMYQLCYVF
jgi:hypothetical protein